MDHLPGMRTTDDDFSVAPPGRRPVTTWLVTRIPMIGYGGHTELDEGWEPFAVTDNYIYARKQHHRWVETTT
jgi:hypothetical protein